MFCICGALGSIPGTKITNSPKDEKGRGSWLKNESVENQALKQAERLFKVSMLWGPVPKGLVQT